MNTDNEKIQRLISIAKLYYLENMTQSEIAKIVGVSRPLISKFLTEARELGLVKIEINDILKDNVQESRSEELCKKYSLKDVYIVPSSSNKNLNDQIFMDYSLEYIFNQYKNSQVLGIGWGNTIGGILERIDSKDRHIFSGTVVPLIGNAPVSHRNYHTNELIRMLSEKTNLISKYLYLPFLCSSNIEKEMFLKTENLREVSYYWNKIDCSIVQIRNFPSAPDLATEARFGKVFQEEKAVGIFLSYYFDINGNILKGENDFSIQIPLESLKSNKKVIGIINKRVHPSAVMGALKTGFFTHIIIDSDVANLI